MSKSVLVIDTPKGCNECRLCFIGNYGAKRCAGKDQAIFLTENQKKPDWCPLQDIPLKKNVRDFNISPGDFEQKGYQQGWNACIDEILGNSM